MGSYKKGCIPNFVLNIGLAVGKLEGLLFEVTSLTGEVDHLTELNHGLNNKNKLETQSKEKVREAAKKSSSTSGRATKRGGGKGRATKEKRTFFNTFFLFCCHLKIKIILL